MLIASWNVNSIKSRLGHVLDWLEEHQPDVLLLQELKSVEFPVESFQSIGYRSAHVGQRAYNGVAIVSKHPMKVLSTRLKGDASDEQARFLEVEIKKLRIVNLYLPNGNPVGTPKFDYKLEWMDRLHKYLSALRKTKTSVIVGGDFNVIPEDIDCASPKYWKDNALFRPEAKTRFRAYRKLGYVDAFRHFNDEAGHYTFWEYFRDSFQKNRGIRIDHFLVSPELIKSVTGCMIDKGPRALEKASDHTPIVLAVAQAIPSKKKTAKPA